MLLVQKYLENHTFGKLAAEHGVYASFSKSGHKFSLNYDQIEAKEANPLAQQCRGLVLSLEDGRPILSEVKPDGKPTRDNMSPGKTKILAYPMNRFFNYGQGSAAKIDWSDPSLSVLEKLDGTLAIVYFDPFKGQAGEWCMATRSVPEADLLMDNGIYTFRTLFEKAVQETTGMSFEELTDDFDKEMTYCFELCTPYNRIVVTYNTCGVTLLAVRKVYYVTPAVAAPNVQVHEDLGEVDFSELHGNIKKVPFVKNFNLSTPESLLDWVSTLNPLEYEGVVVRDSKFNRIKMKNAAYVAYNKLHDKLGSSERNCMEFVLLEKDDDVAAFLPEEIVKNMQSLKSGLQKAIMKYDSVFKLNMLALKALGEETNKKEFALRVTSKKMWHAPFFAMWDGKATSMKEFIQRQKKDGTWGDGFLDKVIEISKEHIQ